MKITDLRRAITEREASLDEVGSRLETSEGRIHKTSRKINRIYSVSTEERENGLKTKRTEHKEHLRINIC